MAQLSYGTTSDHPRDSGVEECKGFLTRQTSHVLRGCLWVMSIQTWTYHHSSSSTSLTLSYRTRKTAHEYYWTRTSLLTGCVWTQNHVHFFERLKPLLRWWCWVKHNRRHTGWCRLCRFGFHTEHDLNIPPFPPSHPLSHTLSRLLCHFASSSSTSLTPSCRVPKSASLVVLDTDNIYICVFWVPCSHVPLGYLAQVLYWCWVKQN